MVSGDAEGEALPGGRFTRLVRIHGRVHREAGPWTPAVHALLRHLEDVGFEGAPRVVGFDESGREVLTYVDGEAGSLALPPALLLERGIRALGQFIRRFHDAAATFVPAEDAVYRIGARALGSGEIVCHGDLGYFNMVWQGDEIVGLIDWDLAEPASPLRDLALAAMTSVPMHGDETASRSGFPLPIDRKGRLAAFCAGYGEITPTEVIEAATEMLAEESERLQRFGAEGREPWATFLERGQLKMFELVAFWMAANRDTLV